MACSHLRRHTKHVCIILHESPDTGETRQRTRSFIPVYNSKFSHPDRQLFITPVPGIKDKTVTWAIHRFQGPGLLLDIERKHVILVILPVP